MSHCKTYLFSKALALRPLVVGLGVKHQAEGSPVILFRLGVSAAKQPSDAIDAPDGSILFGASYLVERPLRPRDPSTFLSCNNFSQLQDHKRNENFH